MTHSSSDSHRVQTLRVSAGGRTWERVPERNHQRLFGVWLYRSGGWWLWPQKERALISLRSQQTASPRIEVRLTETNWTLLINSPSFPFKPHHPTSTVHKHAIRASGGNGCLVGDEVIHLKVQTCEVIVHSRQMQDKLMLNVHLLEAE